jgi:hypothetical protein
MAKKAKDTAVEELFFTGVGNFNCVWNSISRINAKGLYVLGSDVPGMADTLFFQRPRDRGVVRNMPNAEYHRERQHVSSSALKVFKANARKYYRCYVKQDEQPEESAGSDAKTVGSIVHALLLNDEQEIESYEFLPTEVDGVEINPKLKNHKEYLANHKAEGEKRGAVFITTKQYDMASALVEAANQDSIISNLMNYPNAYREISAFASCPDSGQRIKARFDLVSRYTGPPELLKDIPDWSPSDIIIPDIKTSESQNPEQFIVRDVVNFGYHISGALYRKVFKLVTGVMPRFWWLVLAKDKQGDCHSYVATLHPDDWLAAEIEVDQLLLDLARSSLGGNFVSPYQNRVNIGRLPHYLRHKG